MDAGTGIPDAPFRADEIDGLIDEVGDTYDRGDHGSTDNPPMAAAAKTAAQPSTPHDEGTWMGSAEDEVSSSLTGSEPMFDATSGLEDLPDAPIQDSEVAPALLEDGTGNGLEVDRGFDPDWASQPPQAPSRLRSPEPSRASVFDQVGSKGTPGPIESHPPVSGEMVLTEVVTDTALFEDPNLEVASLEPGEAREVVVPVLLGTGAEARRFKLSILLRLDPVE